MKNKIKNALLLLVMLVPFVVQGQNSIRIGTDLLHQKINSSITKPGLDIHGEPNGDDTLISVGQESNVANFGQNSDAIIMSTSLDGSQIYWQRTIGNGNTTNERFSKIIEVDNGSYIVIGSSETIAGGLARPEGLVARYAANGVLQWSRSYRVNTVGNGEIFHDVAYDNQNTIYVCGGENYNANSVNSIITSINIQDGVLAGTLNWTRRYNIATLNDANSGDDETDVLSTIQFNNNRLYLFGYFETDWNQQVPPIFPEYASDHDLWYLCVDMGGNVLVSSLYDYTINGNLDNNGPGQLFVNNNRFLISAHATLHTGANGNFREHVVMGGTIDAQGNLNFTNTNSYQDPSLGPYANGLSLLPTDNTLSNFILAQSPASISAFLLGNLPLQNILETKVSVVTGFNNVNLSRTFTDVGDQTSNSINISGSDYIFTGASANGTGQTSVDAFVINVDDQLQLNSSNPLCSIILDTTNVTPFIINPKAITVTSNLIALQIIPRFDNTLNLVSGSGCGNPCIDSNTVVIDNSNNLVTGNTIFSEPRYVVTEGTKIIVSPGATLDITNVDMVFEDCAGIEVFGTLRSNNSVFRTCEMDRTWCGIQFNETNNNIIAECTFKNALIALDFNDASARINNNYFQDCQYGINSLNSNFSNPITGNNFLYDAIFPNLIVPEDCTPNPGNYAINAQGSTFTNDITKNLFTNSTNTDLMIEGIFTLNSVLNSVSHNRFTNMTRSIAYNEVYDGEMEILNNEIETANGSFFSQIQFNACQTKVNVGYNELNCTKDIEATNMQHAIEAINSSWIKVHSNNISGFNAGIVLNYSIFIEILNNKIFDPIEDGIYAYSSGDVEIRCNEIDMNHHGTGIQVTQCENINIYTNCILNSDIATYFGGDLGVIWPSTIDYYNNYLYNYSFAGVFNDELTNLVLGDAPTRNGLNTFWSNRGGANWDIYTNWAASTIAWNNYYDPNHFGYGGNTKVSHDRLHYSTASCGHQIVDGDNRWRYLEEYDCDKYDPAGHGDPEEAMKKIASSNNKLGMAQAYLSNYRNENLTSNENKLYSLIVSNEELNQSIKDWVSFLKNYQDKKYAQASQILQALNTISKEDIRMKEYYSYRLKYMNQSVQGKVDQFVLNFVSNNTDIDRFTNLEAPILTMNGIKANYFVTPILEKQRPAPGTIVQRLLGANDLEVFPNPSNGLTNLNIGMEKSMEGTIKVFSIEGKKVASQDVTIQSGITKIDLSKLSKGTYLINLVTDEFSKTQKLVIE